MKSKHTRAHAATVGRETISPILKLTLAALLLPAAHARAQSIDYSAMEQIFGEPVTTSATGSPQRATEAPADMTILTQDDIRRSGVDNLPDLLALVPGIQVTRTSLQTADVAVRGYGVADRSPRLLVLINGRPAYDDYYGLVPWNALPVELDQIRQIEVVRGPSSALFGFNAAAGVINIVTYDPLYEGGDTATVRTGTQSLAEGSAMATVRKAGVGGVQIAAGGLRANEFSQQGAASMTPTHPVRGEVNILGRYLIRPWIEFTAGAGAASSNSFVSSGPVNEDYRSNYVRSALAAQTRAGRLELSFFRNQSNLDLVDHFSETNVVYDGQLSDTIKLGTAHVVRVNLEYKDNNSSSDNIFAGGSFGYTDYAGSLMWNWQTTSTLSLTNAVRLDRISLQYSGLGLPQDGYSENEIDDVSHNAVSFNSALVWAVTPLDTIRLLGARGLQLPSLNDLGEQLALGPYLIVGAPHLTPTAVTSVELSYDRSVPALFSTLHAAIFAERNDDMFPAPGLLPPTPTPAGLVFGTSNIGHSDAQGIELGLKGSLSDGLRWNASYALAAITDHFQADVPNVELARYAGAAPRHTAIVGLGYSTGPWELDGSARWQSHFDEPQAHLPQPVLIDGFLTVYGRVGYRITHNITLAVAADQLLRERIMQTVGLQIERRILASISIRL